MSFLSWSSPSSRKRKVRDESAPQLSYVRCPKVERYFAAGSTTSSASAAPRLPTVVATTSRAARRTSRSSSRIRIALLRHHRTVGQVKQLVFIRSRSDRTASETLSVSLPSESNSRSDSSRSNSKRTSDTLKSDPRTRSQ